MPSRTAAGFDVEALLLRVRRQQAAAADTPLDLSDRAEAVRDVRVPRPDVQTFNQLLSPKETKRAANMLKARIKQANFPAAKDFDSYDFTAQPSLNKNQILELARGSWIDEHI